MFQDQLQIELPPKGILKTARAGPSPKRSLSNLASVRSLKATEQYYSGSKKQAEAILRLENENRKLRYMNQQLLQSQKKREEMIAYILEENRKLRA